MVRGTLHRIMNRNDSINILSGQVSFEIGNEVRLGLDLGVQPEYFLQFKITGLGPTTDRGRLFTATDLTHPFFELRVEGVYDFQSKRGLLRYLKA